MSDQPAARRQARSATIDLADSAGARRFLDDWVARIEAAPKARDQQPLGDIAAEQRQRADFPYRLALLLPSLCFIFDFERGRNAGIVPGRPIIEHLQASREGCARKKPEALARRRARVEDLDRTFLDTAE